MKNKAYTITKAAVAVLVFLSFLLLAVSIAWHNGAKVKDATESLLSTTTDTVCYIVYTDTNGDPYAVPDAETTYKAPFYPVTMDEREWISEIVAGKAGNKSESCQRLVANVVFNEIMDCDGDLVQAIKKYDLNDTATPTDATLAAVDAIFYGGELMLDEDVLFFNDNEHKSAFHNSLVTVCENGGITFYKAHRPAVEVAR